MTDGENRKKRRGYLNPGAVRRIAFWTTSDCILVAVVDSLLAIWNFTGTDVLWRTVATCTVIGADMMAFFVIDTMFDWPSE